MPENDSDDDEPRVRSQEEIDGLLPCVRCGHIERRHSEQTEDEEDGVFCHVPGCPCDGWESPV
jgi:hypothetical protein